MVNVNSRPAWSCAGLFKKQLIMQATDFVFPFTYEDRKDGTIVNAGVDLRTWMATQFMATRLSQVSREDWLEKHIAEKVALEATLSADALIAELNKPA